MKPALSDKCQSNNKIVLVEDDEIISDDIEIAEIFNCFFVTVTESLGIKENNDNISGTEGILDPIEKSIQKYSNHPCILKIKSHFLNVESFTFNPVSLEEVETEIKRLNPKKATTFKNIPPKILRIILIYFPNLYEKYLIIALDVPLFLMSLSVQTYPHFINKKKVQLRKTTGQLVFCQLFQKSSRGF